MPGIVSTLTTSATIQTGEAEIASGASSVDVTFNMEFRSHPTICAVLSKGEPGDANLFVLNIASVTKTGFTAYLSAMTANGDYTLHYNAIGF